jgi:hypothetical protein
LAVKKRLDVPVFVTVIVTGIGSAALAQADEREGCLVIVLESAKVPGFVLQQQKNGPPRW